MHANNSETVSYRTWRMNHVAENRCRLAHAVPMSHRDETLQQKYWHARDVCMYVHYGCVCQAELSRQKADPLSQRNGSFAASREVWKYISDSGISTVSSSY